MKFALVNLERRTAERGLVGVCSACGQPVVARCGEVRVPHWAHRGRRTCDPWWDSETPWHRAWKGAFPAEWQEVVRAAPNGERHIADIRTPQGRVIEFQHSFITPKERKSRETFYGRMLWVVNGLRRQRDWDSFIQHLQCARPVARGVWESPESVSRCALLRDWGSSTVPVLFDFGVKAPTDTLWCLLPEQTGERLYLAAIGRSTFIDLHIQEGQELDRLLAVLNLAVSEHTAKRHTEAARARATQLHWAVRRHLFLEPRAPESFAHYSARHARSRRRF